jgi:hypothetical protein
MLTIEDDRTTEQKTALPWLIVGTDSFMSGWGKASGGLSYAAWACDDAQLRDCECWVERRSDMRRVRRVYGKYRPRGCVHLHIYIWKGNET